MKNQSDIAILYVDDEINNLTAFYAGFRRKYKIFTAKSAQEGLEIINNNNIQIVIADQRMPQVTGVEFLQQIRASHSDIIRILLTGYTDAEAIIDAINKGHIYRYINKPWDELELENAINNAYEIYQTRKSLDLKMIELQKVNDELNRFVYSTAHDLRAPLASIMGILNLIDLDDHSEEHQEYLNIIGNCTEKINLYIKKIIEYYKNLRFQDATDPIDFRTLFKNSIQRIKHQYPKIDFKVSIDQTNEFWNDHFRIMIILDNLISNATKFMRPEEPNPTVEIKAIVSDQKAFITIADNGIGISKAFLENIFQMFFRTTKAEEGLGIGLFIVKEALDKLGGTIQVHSELGKGSTFQLEIPNQRNQATT